MTSSASLIVDETAYTLQTSSDQIKEELDGLAGKTATVTGDVTGDTIAVASVTAG